MPTRRTLRRRHFAEHRGDGRPARLLRGLRAGAPALACAVLGALVPFQGAVADRISDMSRQERCVYAAKLQAAAAWHYTQGRARAAVTIHWHGDETPNEIEFVNRTLDAGYAAMIRETAGGRPPPPVELIGDQAFVACMKGDS